MWIAQKLLNALSLFWSWTKGDRKTNFWTKFQIDMARTFLFIQFLRNWCICQSQTWYIAKYKTIRFPASQCLSAQKLIDGFYWYCLISIKIYWIWCTLSFNKIHQLVFKYQQISVAGYWIVSYFAIYHVCYWQIHQLRKN